ncbi:20173_t:CDS:2 [Entrophospora sp. SA101]|nr:20173_t:CDS:2 [Entrophospora sp. SA101]
MNFTIHEGITGEDLFWDMPNPNPKNQLSNNSKNPNDQSTSKIYQDNQTDTNKNPEDTNIDNITSSEITDDLMSDNETIEYDTSSIDTNQEETDHNLIIIQLDLFNKLIKIEKKEKDNVFKMIKIKLGWAYFNQIGWKNINHSDTIRKLQYIAGFIVLPVLPENPGELTVEWKKIFPIKKYSMLKELRKIREKSRIVNELREYYLFQKLPNNYFTPKPRLPNSPDKTTFNYNFPITEQNTVNEFIKEARRKYEITFSINKKWINLSKKYFFERIPDEWISIEKANDNIDTSVLENDTKIIIPNIEKKQLLDLTITKELNNYNVEITIPITDDKKIYQTTQS